MRVIMSCGGTGGHIIPALAIADTVRENCPGSEILFVGGEHGLEKELVPAAGYPITLLRVQGLSRSLSPSNLRVLWQMHSAVNRAKALIADFAPDIVIGTGGYACYPTLRAASLMGVPTAVHESNAVPGLAVKRLAGQVDRVWVNFPSAAQALAGKTEACVVGNPLRYGQTAKRAGKSQGGYLSVLSFGGSLGADAVNSAILALMQEERKMGGIVHLHATGQKHFAAVSAAFSARSLDRSPHFTLVPFIENMPDRMAEADLVICRAGAMSISELAMGAKAAVLIPSPNVTGNHQYKNAEQLARAGAAALVTEDTLESGALTRTVLELLRSREARDTLSRNVTAFACPDANRKILAEICLILRK